MLPSMGRPASTEPYLIPDSKFVRFARRHGLGQIQLTQIALGFSRGTNLQTLARQANTTSATLRWLQRFPWQAALVIPYVPTSVSAVSVTSGPLTKADKVSIRELRALKVGASDIAAYLRLPVALVTSYLSQRDDQEFAPDDQAVGHAACLAG